jgi:hypothetical protein
MPHTDERFYKMALNWTDDPKVADLFRFGQVEGVLARDLFSQMIRYSRANLTDGVGPGALLASLSGQGEDHARQLAAHLADPGSWGPLVELSTDEGTGRIVTWRVLAYARWNDTKADVDARTEAGRTGARARWNGADRNADRNAGRNAKR